MTVLAPTSWGRAHRGPDHQPAAVRAALRRDASLPAATGPVLPFGNGRSYGDSNLNPGGTLLLCRGLDRFIAFDPSSGVLECEAGVLLADILALTVPQGWFLPVTPGTQFVTVGGAIANDVHGKNHHAAGSFGNHVLGLELLRSDESRRWCSADEHADWLAATIGGLGLTGLITRARLQLRRMANPFLDVESIRFGTLEEFFTLSRESEQDHEYTVSWIDGAWGGARLGRGLFARGNHAPAALDADWGGPVLRAPVAPAARRMPLTPPLSLVNTLSTRAFNWLHYHRQRQRCVRALQHYRPFFYPLDGILEWNRMYGPRGFFQYQSVVPPSCAPEATREMLRAITASGFGSFLAVLKVFGDVPSRGLLSFPRPGTTLAIDFPNRGEALHRLFARLDAIVHEAGGRLYPAKDGRMPAALFRSGYPAWERFADFVDPRFSSAFWRRVHA